MASLHDRVFEFYSVCAPHEKTLSIPSCWVHKIEIPGLLSDSGFTHNGLYIRESLEFSHVELNNQVLHISLSVAQRKGTKSWGSIDGDSTLANR